MKTFFNFVIIAFLFVAVVFGLTYGSFELYKFFAPQYRAVDSAVFKESEQYNDGMIRDLTELQRQYVTASKEDKEALRPIIIHRFEVYDKNRLPSDLRQFYDSLQDNKAF